MVAGSVYAGVDARAAEIVDRATWLPRKLQYPYAALRALATYQPGRYRRLGRRRSSASYDAATVVVANSAYYGKGMQIAPAASVEDGVLDVVVIEAASRLALMRSLPKVYDGAHVAPARGHRALRQAGRAPRHAPAPPIPVGGDGEPLGPLPALDAAPAVVEVVPGALAVIC